MKIYQRKESGTWYIRLPGGGKHCLDTKDEREAELLGNAVMKKILNGEALRAESRSRISLSEFRKSYLKDIENEVAEKTQAIYSTSLRMFEQALGGSFQLAAVDEDTIKRFIKACKARGVKKVSINTYLRHIRAALRSSTAKRYISAAPTFKMQRPPKRLPRVLSSDEKDILLLHSKHCDPRMHRYIRFGLLTGARRHEIWNLTWQNVHLTDDFCRLIGKGDKERTMPLIAGAVEAMGEEKKLGHVFHHFDDVDTITHKFKEIARACGIEDIHFHHLRHTAATDMLAAGMRIEYVQKVLGHSSIAVTQIYAHVLEADLKLEIKKLEREQIRKNKSLDVPQPVPRGDNNLNLLN
jgi:integrase/recombinase XerD